MLTKEKCTFSFIHQNLNCRPTRPQANALPTQPCRKSFFSLFLSTLQQSSIHLFHCNYLVVGSIHDFQCWLKKIYLASRTNGKTKPWGNSHFQVQINSQFHLWKVVIGNYTLLFAMFIGEKKKKIKESNCMVFIVLQIHLIYCYCFHFLFVLFACSPSNFDWTFFVNLF
jgi:hypothetical protein